MSLPFSKKQCWEIKKETIKTKINLKAEIAPMMTLPMNPKTTWKCLYKFFYGCVQEKT